jgi:hypothetical protein
LTDSNEKVLIEREDGVDISVKSQFETTTNLAIKSYVLMSSDGINGPIIYFIADGSMDNDYFDVQTVYGLSRSTDGVSLGYLCYTKARGGNAAFFKWLFKQL